MKQFILGKNVAYADALPLNTVGEIAFVALVNGVETLDPDGTKIKDKGYIYLLRDEKVGGQVVIPIYKNKFSYSKMTYQAATAYTSNFTIAEVTPGLDYTVIVAKKGVNFNERFKWTATVRAKSSDTATTVAKALVDLITANGDGSGVTATNDAGKVTITAKEKGVDYKVTLADDIFGLAVTETAAKVALADAAYVKDLAMKAAADAGIEYTYDDFIYPNYPLNPLAQPDAADTGFTIFTLKFAEPREMKTMDTAVNQIVQIALPTGAGAIASIETILKALSGVDAD